MTSGKAHGASEKNAATIASCCGGNAPDDGCELMTTEVGAPTVSPNLLAQLSSDSG
ncbi:MAG: hypothetical protein V4568_00810 [Pseudomonadota bacterium]